jgi:hypothetical protein
MTVRLSALRADRALPLETFSGTHFCYRLSKPPTAIVRLEGLVKLKKIIDLIGLEPTTLRLVA